MLNSKKPGFWDFCTDALEKHNSPKTSKIGDFLIFILQCWLSLVGRARSPSYIKVGKNTRKFAQTVLLLATSLHPHFGMISF
ncbi:hypothetical protein WA1_30890 [Scytonema hofmannii PCC 7110]|uniref:Uncharacterized protein n=1 Tax=Scytonema hofmannii PCC 7110 TaxID=128403 RepID=A0A139X4Z6_9CYAN|nr:hypothetical protein WA1_30890 [Scytonema hofmannii PCC 7110]